MATGPIWANHRQDGATFAIDHLHPTFVDYAIPAIARTARKPGRTAMNVKVRITYSHHCFTQALGKVENANSEHDYNCTKRPNDRRVFCPSRWRESIALPAIVRDLKTCYFTRHHNYFVWRNPTNPALGDYFVYFTVTRRGGFVDLEIESAYPRADGDEVKRGASKVSLTTLIVNAALGRSIHAPLR